ncbi:unnamed protein product, partial [Mesorhabditis belari]|uniref:Neurotransmitter-gated ion-channel ligand-binding domain-containing protein n=1 Tax=Mesorhabditis belari TaxID=2138241 RepID=A0AAF3FML1_9BILA
MSQIILFSLLLLKTSLGLENKPITLYASLFIENIHSFDWSNGDFESTVELLLTSESSETSQTFELSTIDAQTEPHPFSDVAFDSHKIQVLGEMRWVVRAGGDVVTSKQRSVFKVTINDQRVRLTSNCRFSTWRYPFEKHTCSIRVVSPRHTAAQLTLQWSKTSSPIRIVSNRLLTPSGAEIQDLTPVSCSYDSVYSITSGGSKTARHSCLEARFIARRPMRQFIVRFVIPSLLIPFLLWISFFVIRSNPTLRFFIISSAAFLVSILCLSLNYNSPSSDSITLADLWNLVHIIFLIFGLLHFAVMIFLQNSHNKYLELARKSDWTREESRRRYERRAGTKVAQMKLIGNGNGEKNGSAHEQEPLTASYDRVIFNAFRSNADKFSLYSARWDILGRSLLLPAYFLTIFLYFLWNLILYDEKTYKS